MSGKCFSIGNWVIELREEWSQLWTKCNWYTITPVSVELEDDRLLGAAEASLALLGFSVRVRWNHTATQYMAELERRIDEIREREDA